MCQSGTGPIFAGSEVLVNGASDGAVGEPDPATALPVAVFAKFTVSPPESRAFPAQICGQTDVAVPLYDSIASIVLRVFDQRAGRVGVHSRAMANTPPPAARDRQKRWWIFANYCLKLKKHMKFNDFFDDAGQFRAAVEN